MVVNFWWLCDAFKAEFIVHTLKWDTTEGGKVMCYPGKTLSSICWKKKRTARKRNIATRSKFSLSFTSKAIVCTRKKGLHILNNHIHSGKHTLYKDTCTDQVFGLETQQKSTKGRKTDNRTVMAHWTLQSDLLHNIFGPFHSLSFDFNQQWMAGIGLILPLSI